MGRKRDPGRVPRLFTNFIRKLLKCLAIGDVLPRLQGIKIIPFMVKGNYRAGTCGAGIDMGGAR
jgi:hypothetical protein